MYVSADCLFSSRVHPFFIAVPLWCLARSCNGKFHSQLMVGGEAVLRHELLGWDETSYLAFTVRKTETSSPCGKKNRAKWWRCIATLICKVWAVAGTVVGYFSLCSNGCASLPFSDQVKKEHTHLPRHHMEAASTRPILVTSSIKVKTSEISAWLSVIRSWQFGHEDDHTRAHCRLIKHELSMVTLSTWSRELCLMLRYAEASI